MKHLNFIVLLTIISYTLSCSSNEKELTAEINFISKVDFIRAPTLRIYDFPKGKIYISRVVVSRRSSFIHEETEFTGQDSSTYTINQILNDFKDRVSETVNIPLKYSLKEQRVQHGKEMTYAVIVPVAENDRVNKGYIEAVVYAEQDRFVAAYHIGDTNKNIEPFINSLRPEKSVVRGVME